MTSLNRVPFCNQKYIYILLHYTRESPNDLRVIYDGLREILTVSAAVSGSTRIPGIGMGILGCPFHQVIPMSAVKGCLERLLAKLEKILTIRPYDSTDNVVQLLESALSYVLKGFIEFAGGSQHSKMKLILFTWDTLDLTMAAIASYVNAVQTLSISSAKVYLIEDLLDGGWTALQRVPDPFDTTVGLQIAGDFLQVNQYSVRLIFKEWLSEDPGKNAHVALTFLTQNAKKIVYADIHESAIDPALLPTAVASKLHLPLNTIRMTTTTAGQLVNVAELEVVRRFTTSSLSAAWHYGLVLYLVPSAAEVFSFEEFWENSQRMQALCECLEIKDEALLCRGVSAGGPTVSGTIQAHYLVCSHNKALTLTHVIPPELILIERFHPSSCDAPKKYKDQMEEVLNGLESSDFQVEHLPTTLTPLLVNHLSRTSNRVIQKWSNFYDLK